MVLDNILRLLNEKGEMQKELCAALGINTNTLTEWKAGRSKSYMKYIDKIADHFGVSVAYLMGETEDRTPRERITSRKQALLELVNSLSDNEIELAEQYIKFITESKKKGN